MTSFRGKSEVSPVLWHTVGSYYLYSCAIHTITLLYNVSAFKETEAKLGSSVSNAALQKNTAQDQNNFPPHPPFNGR